MITPLAIAGPVQLPSSAAALYTVPALTTVTVTRGFLLNESASVATATLWLVRSGDSHVDSNIILGAAAAGLNVSAGPADPYVVASLAGLVLEAGDAIWGESGTANVINFVMSGWKQT